MLETGKKLSKEERIAQRAQRLAVKHGKLDVSASSQHRDDQRSLSFSSDAGRLMSGAQSSVLKHRQPPQFSPSPTPQAASNALLSTIQSQLHAQSADSLAAVEAIQRSVESKERERREKTESDRVKRHAILATEQAQSREAADNINEHFTRIQVKNEVQTAGIDAKQLYTDIAAVYAETVAVLQSKDALISELNTALTAVDRESVDCINQHASNVGSMIDSLKTQSANFQSECESSLQSLRQTFDGDRRAFMQAHEQTLNALYDKRKTMELTRLESEIQRETTSAEALDSLRSRDDEDYYLLKQELETSIAQFSEQLEEMRNLYLFNAEKLNYHSHILYARSASHRATIEHSRQMIRTWRETCSQVAAQAAKQEEKLDKENEVLRCEYVQLTSKLKSLQEQWAFTQTRQAELYQSIYDMHINHVMQSARKLLHAERIIATQILGFDANEYGSRFQGKDIETLELSDLLDHPSQSNNQSNNLAITQSNSQSITQEPEAASEPVFASVTPGLHTRHSRTQIEQLLKLLVSECSYLIDRNHVERLKGEEIDELWVSGDSILQSINVSTAEDLDELCSIFFTDPNDETPNIHPNDVTSTIKQFIETHGSTKQSSSVTTLVAKGTQPTNQTNNQSSQSDRALWQTLSSVINPSTESIWDTLDTYLTKYNGLLDRRQALVLETGEMTRENDQLKQLLANYQHASISEELLIPPTQLIRTTVQPINMQSTMQSTIKSGKPVTKRRVK